MSNVYNGPVIVLDRVVSVGPEPSYCIHGQTQCIRCASWCWLGNRTYPYVATGRAAPLCHECAIQIVPPDASFAGRIVDGP